MKYTFDNVTRIIITIVIISIILLLINYLSSVLLPFLLGWLIAYLMHPLVNFVQNKMRVRKRGLSIAISMVFVLSVIIGLIATIIPMVGLEMGRATTLIGKLTNDLSHTNKIPEIINPLVEYISKEIDFKQMLNFDNIENISKKILPQVYNLLSGTWQIIATTFIVFIVFMYVVFILLDYEAISNGFIKLIPNKYSHYVSDIIEDVENGMNKYFRGQMLIASIVGILFAVGFKIIGLPLGITIGIFIGVLNIVPYMQTIGLIPIPFLAFLQCIETGQNYWVILLMCIIVFVIVQGFQDLFLVPKIMGKAMGLNPAVILLSLSIWGALMGFIGMIIALPFTTILISYYKRYILKQNISSSFEDNSVNNQ